MKKKLFIIIVSIIVLVGLIVGAIIVFKPATAFVNKDGYNAAIAEVCEFYHVQIADYDEKALVYLLNIDSRVWDAHDDLDHNQICRYCQEAFDRMMHKYGMISESESVDLKFYKNGSLVASVIDGSVEILQQAPADENDFSFGLADSADAFVEEFTEAYNKIYDGIMDSYKEKEKELLKEFGY